MTQQERAQLDTAARLILEMHAGELARDAWQRYSAHAIGCTFADCQECAQLVQLARDANLKTGT